MWAETSLVTEWSIAHCDREGLPEICDEGLTLRASTLATANHTRAAIARVPVSTQSGDRVTRGTLACDALHRRIAAEVSKWPYARTSPGHARAFRNRRSVGLTPHRIRAAATHNRRRLPSH
jgi:hypothetical protein